MKQNQLFGVILQFPSILARKRYNIKKFNLTWIAKPREVLWFVSNCKTDHTKRMEFYKSLEKATSLSIDVYGKCGKGKVPKEDEKTLWSKYKFYLAFENSNCRDYVTEKFFKVLDKGVIPIVRGAPKR